MVAVRLTGEVDQDGQLIVKLPENIPPGTVDLILRYEEGSAILVEVKNASPVRNQARDAARAKLAAAGLLSSARWLPSGIRIPTDTEVRAAGVLPPGARPSEELIREDRDEG